MRQPLKIFFRNYDIFPLLGNVTYIRHYKNLVSCPMDFTWYPMDVQTCALKFVSWKPDYVKLTWSEAKMFTDVLRHESGNLSSLTERSLN